jgi:WD40 repeat protein/uncharacterized caspase-like protein
MVKHWAIAIGINQYSFLPPLQYAKQDAQAIETFLSAKAGFDNVFFFSDDSPAVQGKSTQPTRANLLRVLRQAFESPFMEAGDNFWFFFSGHGVRYQDRDYLLPVDGDPEDIENTGISIHYITERLRRCGADNVVLILDACRNQSARVGQGIGNQTAEIARQTGVISLFSCSPNEYSYEVDTLQRGLFTHALLEGFGSQGQCATIESLGNYLSSRVPELAQQHRKPRQTPYVIAEPMTRHHLILLTQHATSADIALLKNDAYRAAQIDNNLALSEQLWIRVLAASSGKDMEAIRALQNIARLRVEPETIPGASSIVPSSSTSSVALLATPVHLVTDAEMLTQTMGDDQGSNSPSGSAIARSPQVSHLAQKHSDMEITTQHSDRIQTIAINGDGTLLASGSQDQTIKLWDLETGKLLQTFSGHSNRITAIAFVPNHADPPILVSGSGDNTIKLWNCQTGALLDTLLGHSGWVLAIALSADGKTLVSGSADGSIQRWDLEQREEHKVLAEHQGWVSCLALSSDGKLLASGSYDNTITLWRFSNGELLHTFSGHRDRIQCVAFCNKDHSLVGASQDHTITVWHLGREKLQRRLVLPDTDNGAIALSQDGGILASSHEQTVQLRRLGQDKPFYQLPIRGNQVSAIALSSDGTILATATRNGVLHIWQSSTRRSRKAQSGRSWAKQWVAGLAILLATAGTPAYVLISKYCETQNISLKDCLIHNPMIETMRTQWFKY